jgi:hypothetical protein
MMGVCSSMLLLGRKIDCYEGELCLHADWLFDCVDFVNIL